MAPNNFYVAPPMVRAGKGGGGEGGRERGEEGKGRRKGRKGDRDLAPPPRKKILAPPLGKP